MPHRASAPGLVPGQWARGRERNGVADGVGRRASGPGQRGWGAGDSTHFSPFPDLFFFSFSSARSCRQSRPDHLAARHASTAARSQILPLLASTISNVAMHFLPRMKMCSTAGDRLSDGRSVWPAETEPFGSLFPSKLDPNRVWSDMAGCNPEGPEECRLATRGLQGKADMDFDVAALPLAKCHSPSTFSALLLQDGCNPRSPPVTGQMSCISG
jgi:hypothetical protein